VDVHGDERAAVCRPLAVVVREPDAVLEGFLGDALKLCVDRQANGVARLRELAELPLARHAPERVDEDAAHAGSAAQEAVVDRLDSGLADDVARGVALLRARLELLLRDLADIAEDLRGDRAVVVATPIGLRDLHAGKLGLVLHQVRGLAIADVRVDQDRRQRVTLRARVHFPAHVLLSEPEQAGEALEHPHACVGGNVFERRRPDLHDRAGCVRHEHGPVPVDDRAPGRLEAETADLVVLGVLEVALAGDDLERPQAEEERAEDGDDEDAEDGDAKRELRRDAIRLLDARVRRQEPRQARAGGSRQPVSLPHGVP
jgi:hypothetical protein